MPLPGNVTNDEAAVTRVLADYYSAFSALEVQRVLSYFHEPCLFIGPQGLHAAPDHAALTAAIAPTMEGLRARGYGRSELDIRQLRSLSSSAITVTGIALRYKLDGDEMERVGLTYVMHKAHDRWKIAVLIFHDTGE